ncbi:MAG: response regulator [Desulfotignum sp.]|nr:response regulator [Desulfotignum sp.]
MKTILIVDDIKVNLKVLEVLLTRNGYDIISALSGKKALSLLQVKHCDLVISDIHMPEMDGFQFCRLCKLDDTLKHIPFVFYSSTQTGARARKLARKVGARAVISKPADPATLLKTIDTILSEYSSSFQDRRGKKIGADGDQQTGRKRSVNALTRQEDLIQHEQLQNRLLRNLPCTVWTLDARGNIPCITPAVEKITGFSIDKIQEMGKSGWLDRVYHADAARVRTAYKNLFKNHAALDIEYRFACLNGDLIWLYEKSSQPYKKEGLHHVDGFTTDISETKTVRARQLKSREKQVINTFSKGVAHDLDNLLAGIADYIELSGMASTTPRERNRFLANALKISRSARALTREFSFLSSAGKPVEKNTSFSHVVSRVARSLLSGTDIKYTIDIPKDLWPCRVDSRLMSQAVGNIIVNASESVAPMQGVISVILENVSIEKAACCCEIVVEPGHYIKATVQDNGCGVDKNDVHQILDPYFSSKPRDIKKGIGLSLALSEAIIARHGGVTGVRSRGKAGTDMEIYLPAARE